MSVLLRRIPGRAYSLVGGALLVVTLLGSLVATAGPASATAGGCHFWGSVYIPILKVDLPNGEYCFGVSGSGTRVNYTYGNYTTMWLYDWTEVVHFYDQYGNVYATFREQLHGGYSYGGHAWRTTIHGTARKGTACGTLLSDGLTVATACIQIK
jgi:hypothetical protein